MKSTTEKAEAIAARHREAIITAARSQWQVAIAEALFEILESGETLSLKSLWDKLQHRAVSSTNDVTKAKLYAAIERLAKFVPEVKE